MKIKNILYFGVALVSLTACNDYLDVDAPSAYTNEFVYSQESEIERALNGVYAQALVSDLYGNAYQYTFQLNSDVDIRINSGQAHTHDGYYRFDCDPQGGDINKFWTAAYNLIEYANRFVYGIENSPLYDSISMSNSTLNQWLGEAKCLRAMAYHDLVVMWGDVPFTFEPAAQRGNGYIIPIVDRTTIQKALIEDLAEASTYMKSTSSVTVERCSKEFAQGLIARIALTAGGYSLRPDKTNSRNYGTMERPDNYREFYQIAMQYADSVIQAGNHSLSQDYQDVFVNECNYKVVNNDDPIFEIPFAKESTGNTGYLQGPTYSAYNSETVGPWGACSGSVRTNAFYRFLFRPNDKRREFVNGLWYYSYFTNSEGVLEDTVYIRNDYSCHNNKWSKLWTDEGSTLGKEKSGSTGINFPYMRYADILLMYAEAANEINEGPTDQAINCLTQVHNRAFTAGDATFIAAASTSKEAFQKAVMDERKWEFAGENSRWRDLVRTNTYSVELVYSFLRYYSAGLQAISGTTGFEDAINEHDGNLYNITTLPRTIYFHAFNAAVDTILEKAFYKSSVNVTFYGYQVDENLCVFKKSYPNQSLASLRIYNAYKPTTKPGKQKTITDYGFKATEWNSASFYNWGNDNTGLPNDQCKYSFYGFIRGDENGNIYVIENGAATPLPDEITAEKLPVVRYILPYSSTAVQRSAGAYVNSYGY